MPALVTPPRLYVLCLDVLVPAYTRISALIDWDDKRRTPGPLDTCAGRYVEDMLLRAYTSASCGRRAQPGAAAWDDDWRIFLTPQITCAVLPWSQRLLEFVASTCHRLTRVLVCRWSSFTPDTLGWLPRTVTSLDFDGELFYRGRASPDLDFRSDRRVGAWLPDAETVLKAMRVNCQKMLVQGPADDVSRLTELHLGDVGVDHEQLGDILARFPALRLLRHYQLVKALYTRHAEQWRAGHKLPTYKLRNFDVDFSHVVRCRMSPEPVLPPDALRLAVRLCPDATRVRVRYDCETPHDVLLPLTRLRRMRELSVVCVSSGQRTLLDFADIRPVLERHGPGSMTALELKVIEEVDVHVIVTSCPCLELLVLSGCGHVTPPTCRADQCAGRLRRLRLLFFADGDDFSWDHCAPPCFWRATLGAHALRGDSSHPPRLEGLFLESPRIPPSVAQDLFPSGRPAPLFPRLHVLSLCRCPELSVDHVAALCGVGASRDDAALRYVRLSRCEGVGEGGERRLRGALKRLTLADSLVLKVD